MQQAERQWMVALLVACAMVVGCGDGDGGRPRSTATTTPAATAAATASATALPSATATGVPSQTSTHSSAPTATATPPQPTATVTPTDTAVPLTSAQVLAPGPFGAGVTTTTFEDTARPTMPNGAFPGATSRTLVTEIWYPAAALPSPPPDGWRDAPLVKTAAPYPLVIYSHGFLDQRTGGANLARHLASYGYVVAAADFPLSHLGAPGGPTISDIGQQPGDVSVVIDRLLALTQQTDSPWFGAIDADRVGVTGLSLGGLTTSLVAFHPALRDPRVRAAAPVAGIACFFGPLFYDDSHVPLLVVHGDLDAIVPYVQNGRFQFATANAPTYLATLHGGSHTGFSSVAPFLPGNNPDDIGCAALLPNLPPPGSGGPTLVDLLGGSAAGLLPDADCPLPCTDPTPRPTALRGARQLDLETLAVFPFFEAALRGNAAMRQFLETRLAAENPEITLEQNP